MKSHGIRAVLAHVWRSIVAAAACLLIGLPALAADPGRLHQLSTRSQVLNENGVMIAGFIIGGFTPKTVMITVAGPSLASFGIAHPLANPTLTLIHVADRTIVATNDDWSVQTRPGDIDVISNSGLRPNAALEPAIVATLPPGAYTAVVQGVNGGTGVAVIGVFEIDHPEVPLLNLSTRARVLTGEDVMIAGFIIDGTQPQSVVINVAGPSLSTFFFDPLADPVLALIRGSDNSIIATNDDWQTQAPADVAAILASGFQPNHPKEPAIIATLQPGTYTAIASGAGAGTGIGVIGVFAANRDLTITSAASATFQTGQAGTFLVETTGTPAATGITYTGTLPAGVTLTYNGNGTATLAGTPAAGTGGTYPITITATNGFTAPAAQNFTLTVNQPPAITSANNTTFVVGTAGTFNVVATGFPAAALSMTGALPSGVTFNAATGVLAGTPATGTGGTYPLVFTAANGIGSNATQNFTLTINAGPVFTSANAATFTVGTAGTFTVTTTSTPVAGTITFTGTLPGGVTFTNNGNGTATIAGTPGALTGGTYTIVITANNTVAPNTQTFTLTVNQAPAITSANNTTFVTGTVGNFQVVATGFPAPTFTSTGALPGGVTLSSSGVLSGNPATSGSFPIVITASNGIGANATQNFTLTVQTAAAITSGNTTTFTAGSAGTFTVTATGVPTPTLAVTGTLPAGTVSFTPATGVLAGTPNATAGGSYPLVVTATNGVGSPATQNFTLVVNQAPAITSANNTTFTTGTVGNFQVVATGFPAPTFTSTGALPGGVTLSPGGILSGNPASSGSFPITITASNGIGVPATQSFTLTVNTAPAITSGNTTTFTAGSAGTFTVTATGVPTPTLSVTGTLPAGTVTFTPATGVLAGTPNATAGGSYPLVVTATNGVGATATQNFTLIVNQAPNITSANNTTFTTGTVGNFQAVATGFPAPTFTSTGALPGGVTLSPGGLLSGNPASSGSFPITITASNGVGAPSSQSFTLTVQTGPAITSPNGVTFQAGSPGTFTVTATGVPAPTLSVSGALPPLVTFTPATGVLAGTPNALTGGVYPLVFSANNGVGPAVTQNFTLTVVEAPTITSANNTTFTVGTLGNFVINASGFPLPAISITGALPAGVGFTPGNGTASFSGTPNPGTGGTYTITITASNGIGANSVQSFTLNVLQGSLAVDDSYTTVHDTLLTVPAPTGLLLNDSGVPPPTVASVTGTGLPCSAFPCTITTTHSTLNGVVVQSDGSFTYLPAANYADNATPDSFTYTATNGVTSSSATVRITVTDIPAIVDLNGAAAGIDFGPVTFTEASGTPALFVDPTLTITDADGTQLADATITITNLLDGANEVLTVTCPNPAAPPDCSLPAGTIKTTDIAYAGGVLLISKVASLAEYESVLRTLRYHNNSVNPTTTNRIITVEVNDRILDNAPLAQAIVSISAVNNAPTVTAPASASTPVNTAKVFAGTISVADVDANLGDVTVTLTATNGTLSLASTAGFTSLTGNGTPSVVATGPLGAQNTALNGLTFNPTNNFNGTATLTILINDNGNTGSGGPLTANGSFNITVNTPPSFTSANATTFTVGQAGNFSVTATGVPAVTSIVRGGVALPSGVNYTDNGNGTGTLNGTPAAGTAGTYVFTFTASNGVPPDTVQNPFTLTINKQTQTISFTSTTPIAAVVGGATYVVTATATSALGVTFAIDPTAASVCSIAGATVSFIGVGSCVINANQAGDGTFSAAPQVQQSFLVGKGSQAISFTSTAPVAAKVGGPTYLVTATGGASGNAVTFTIDAAAAGVCTIAGSTVSFITAGTCVIDANQAGNANYNAAPQVQQTFLVAKGDQAISFTSTAPVGAKVGAATYNVTATGGASGNPVTFSTASAACSVVGSTVTFLHVGTCAIDANQAGDSNYNAATQATQSFAIAKGDQTIAFTSTAPTKVKPGDPAYIVTATASSGLAVALSLDGTSAGCTLSGPLSGASVNFTVDGTCKIDANQTGNGDWNAATQVQQSILVDAPPTVSSTSPLAAAANVPLANNIVFNFSKAVNLTGTAFTLTCNSIAQPFTASGSGTATITLDPTSNLPPGVSCTATAIATQIASLNATNMASDSVLTFTSGIVVVNESYPETIIGNVSVNSANTTPSAFSVLANDTICASPVLALVGGGLSANNGNVSLVTAAGATQGQFTYNPPAGFTGSDTFQYTVTCGASSGTGTVTVPIAATAKPWFIDNNAAACTTLAAGCGRLSNPFSTLAALNALNNGTVNNPKTTDVIYLAESGSDYVGPLVLLAGQKVVGQDATGSFDSATGLTFTNSAVARPTLNTSGPIVRIVTGNPVIQLNQNNTLSGFTLGNALLGIKDNGVVFGLLTVSNVTITTTGAALELGSGSVTGAFTSITSSGGANHNIALSSVTASGGPFSFGGGALSGATNAAFATNSTFGDFTYSGTITNAGTVVDLVTTNSGSMTFSGNLNPLGAAGGISVSGTAAGAVVTFSGTQKKFSKSSGTAVLLSSNPGTINFLNGGLDITGTSGAAGFAANTGSGTVSVTGTGNKISTQTGRALDVTNMNIGAGLIFESISAGTGASGPVNGIRLDTTGSAAGLTVTGNSGTCTLATPTCTGGQIQHATADGILLNNTAKVSLTRMNIHNNTNNGIGGATVNGFVLDTSVIASNGSSAATDDSGIDLIDLTGTASGGSNPTSITNSAFNENFEFELKVTNSSGTLTDFVLSSNTFSATGSSGVHSDLVAFQALGSASMKLSLTGGTFTGSAPNTATGVFCDHSGTSGTVRCNISGATFTNNNNALTVSQANGGNLNFNVANNNATGNRSHGLNLFVAAVGTGSVDGSFLNNVVGTLGVAGSGSDLGFGIRVQNEGIDNTHPVNVLIGGNTVQEMNSFAGINVNQGIAGQATSKTTNATITNNVVQKSLNNRAIIVQQNNSTNPSSAGTTCVDISGNEMNNIAGNVGDLTKIRFRELTANGGVFNIRQPTDAAGVAAANSPPTGAATTTTTAAQVSIGGTPAFSQAICTQPAP